MKWFRKNWLMLLLIVIIGTGIFEFRKDIRYNAEIKAKNDSIVLLKTQYDSLDDREAVVLELLDNYAIDVTSYQDSLLNIRKKYVNQKKRYAEQVADFNRMPTDSLYLEYIRWIDTISFE